MRDVAAMFDGEEILESRPAGGAARSPRARGAPSRIGLVVHPSRAVERPVRELRQWAGQHGAELVQIPVFCAQQQVAAHGSVNDCDLVVAIGGDGTTLAAIRAGAVADRPVLGIACGSLGVLATVPPNAVAQALDRFSRDDWVPHSLPALDVARDPGEPVFAFNDIAIVRAGQGQVRVTAQIDGTLFARFAGDGCIVSTPVGSSAYALAAGGPLLTLGTDGFLLTPLTVHGGWCPPLVVGAESEVRLDVTPGHGGARLELDGQVADTRVGSLTISFRKDRATIVTFDDQETFLARLRRRQIIADSPRILAEDGLG